jgi:hypothetical protein
MTLEILELLLPAIVLQILQAIKEVDLNKPIGALPSWQLLAVWYLGSIHSMYDT